MPTVTASTLTTATLAVLLVVVVLVAWRQVSGLRQRQQVLMTELAEAQGELARMDERVQRRAQELDLAQGELARIDTVDRLTGLANPRHLDDALKREFARLKRSGQPLSVICLSLDHFRNFVDIHGVPAVEDGLRRVGAMLSQRLQRGSDVAAHLGKGEFVLVLPETDFSGGQVVAEQVRQKVEQLALAHNGSSVARVVTVSVGLATVSATQLASAADALQLAQAALARAREAGGNRVAASQRVRASA